MSPEVIPLSPMLAVEPNVIGAAQVPFAFAEDVAVVNPLSIISSPLGTVAAEPSSAVKFFGALSIEAANTITRRVSESLMTTRVRLLNLVIRSRCLVLLKRCLGYARGSAFKKHW